MLTGYVDGGDTVGADFAAQVPHSLLRLIPNAGHRGNAEQPEVVNAAIRERAARSTVAPERI